MASSAAWVGPPPEVELAPFVDGQYVRLRNRGRGGYLFADESGLGVSVDPRRGMVNTMWAVQIVENERGAVHVLLRGAYGRSLGATYVEASPGHTGCNAAQCVFDTVQDSHVMWWTTPGTHGSVVLLNGTLDNCTVLRANGRYRRWNKGVTVQSMITNSRVSSMMEWQLQVIPMREERPPYHLRLPRPPSDAPAEQICHQGSRQAIDINFTVANDDGSIRDGDWTHVQFYGRSLIQLGNELAQRLGNGIGCQDITLFVRAGHLGQPAVLLTDLPDAADDPIEIVVFRVDTPGHNLLVFPDLDAE